MKSVKYFGLALILVLGLMGGAYAAWETELTIDGTVSTGDIDPLFTNAVVADEYEDNVYTPESSHEDHEMEVAETTVQITNNDKKLEVEVDNAYPDYWSEVEFDVTNEGSVSVIIDEINIEGDVGNELEVELEGIHEGDELGEDEKVTGTLNNEITDSASEDETYEYDVTISFIQWNLFEK